MGQDFLDTQYIQYKSYHGGSRNGDSNFVLFQPFFSLPSFSQWNLAFTYTDAVLVCFAIDNRGTKVPFGL